VHEAGQLAAKQVVDPHGKAAQEVDAVLGWLTEHMKIRVRRKAGKTEIKITRYQIMRLSG
jgi:hypothetical protein